MKPNVKDKVFTVKDYKKLQDNIMYIADVAEKSGLDETKSKELGFHLGDVLEDMEKLVNGVKNKNLIPKELYILIVHLNYHLKLAYKTLVLKKARKPLH